MRSTKIRENNRKKRIGNLVTGIVNSFGEISLKNLTHHVNNHAKQSIEYISSAVRRSLHVGVRCGFFLKHNKKYSLANRNYKTDGDGRGARGEYERSAVDKARDARRYENCGKIHDDCNYVGRYLGRCEALDLLTFERCTREHTDGENFCGSHSQLEFLFFYRQIFTHRFSETSVLNILLNNPEMSKRIREPFSGRRPNVHEINNFMKPAEEIYLGFFEKYYSFIFFGYEEHRELMEKIFQNKFTATDEGRSGCRGIDLRTGLLCNNPVFGKNTCFIHYHIKTITKGFSHLNDRNSGYFDDTRQNVLNAIFGMVTMNNVIAFKPKWGRNLHQIKAKVEHAIKSECIKIYLTFIVRLETVVIMRVN